MNKTRLFILGLAVASLLASCKKGENTNTAAEGPGFKAVTEHNGDGSRTYLDGVDVKWMEGDAIKVRNSNRVQQVFNLVGGANSMYGNFYDANVEESFYEPDYIAIYPATNADGVANTISILGTPTFTLPATQTITATGTFANKAMPMVARSSTQTLEFKNLLGGLVIPLIGNSIHVSKIQLVSLRSNDKLWGNFYSSNGDDPYLTNTGSGDNQLTILCDETLDPVVAKDFIFLVPPGTLNYGFTIKVYDGDEFLYEKTVDWSSSPVQGFIPRSVLRKVNTDLEIEEHDFTILTVSPTFISTNSALGIGNIAHGISHEYGIIYALESDLNNDPASNLVLGGPNVHSLDATNTHGRMYDVMINGLTKDQVYFVRAWAKDESDVIGYGDPIPFATRKDYANDYGGKIPFAFSVSPDKQVYFSSGNLQYTTTGQHAVNTDPITMKPGTWRFAEYQFERVFNDTYGNVYANGQHPDPSLNGVKSDNANVSSTYTGWIDMFGWGTSGYHDPTDNYNVFYYPYSSDVNYYHDRGYGPTSGDLLGVNAKYDWGVFNAISNGGNEPGLWRTMTTINDFGSAQTEALYPYFGEWRYLIYWRDVNYGYSFSEIHVRCTSADELRMVNGSPSACSTDYDKYVVGVILYPDEFEWPEYVNNQLVFNEAVLFDEQNSITEAQWSLLEHQGAVFLPNTAYRQYNVIQSGIAYQYHPVNDQTWKWGYYYSASRNRQTNDATGIGNPHFFEFCNFLNLGFLDGEIRAGSTCSHPNGRSYAMAVRLVQDAN